MIFIKVDGEGVRLGAKRKTRADKKSRVQVYMSEATRKKFSRLTRACNVTESEMGLELINCLLNNPNYIVWVQNKYGVAVEDPFRIIPTIENGHVIF